MPGAQSYQQPLKVRTITSTITDMGNQAWRVKSLQGHTTSKWGEQKPQASQAPKVIYPITMKTSISEDNSTH